MADVKISAIPTDSSPTTDDIVPTVDIGTTTTKKVTIANLIALFFNNIPSTSATVVGWNNLSVTPNTISALGNRSYSMLFNGVDLTSTLSKGMRIRGTRTTAAPTKCTSLNGTTQYYSKSSPAGMAFTNNFVVSAWVKVSSYQVAGQSIAGRYNGTSGWLLYLESTGQVSLSGYNAGGGNFSKVISSQSVPLNKWVHVAAQLDMLTFTATTTTSYVMMDGVDVPASVSRGGTNPTALIQAGNLEIGGTNGGTIPFSGKIAQVAIYSAKVTQATILASMHQTLAGTETSLASAYSFNNTINDLNTTSANNLTANGSAVATNADSPYAQAATAGSLEYGIITDTTFSTNTTITVQVPEGSAFPTSATPLSATHYSGQKVPYGFPVQRGKWVIGQYSRYLAVQSAGTINQWYNLTSTSGISGAHVLNIPIGEWQVTYQATLGATGNAGPASPFVTLSTANNTELDRSWTYRGYSSTAGATALFPANRTGAISLTTATLYYLNTKSDAATTSLNFYGGDANTLIEAELAYL